MTSAELFLVVYDTWRKGRNEGPMRAMLLKN
jgi:hypothetical protein